MKRLLTFVRYDYAPPDAPSEATEDWQWVIFREVRASDAASLRASLVHQCNVEPHSVFVLERPGGFVQSMRDARAGTTEAVLRWLRSGGKSAYDRTGNLPSIDEMARCQDPAATYYSKPVNDDVN